MLCVLFYVFPLLKITIDKGQVLRLVFCYSWNHTAENEEQGSDNIRFLFYFPPSQINLMIAFEQFWFEFFKLDERYVNRMTHETRITSDLVIFIEIELMFRLLDSNW